MMVKSFLAGLLIILLASCSMPAPNACGETFCFGQHGSNMKNISRVEDFNLYNIPYNGSLFVVYEGNNPTKPNSYINTNGFKMDTDESMVEVGESICVYIRENEMRWPNYITVCTKDKSKSRLLVKLVSTINRR